MLERKNYIKETWKIFNSITKKKRVNAKLSNFVINYETIKDPKEISKGL